MRFFEVLLSNPLLLIIAIGAISSYFKKKSEPNERTRQPQKPINSGSRPPASNPGQSIQKKVEEQYRRQKSIIMEQMREAIEPKKEVVSSSLIPEVTNKEEITERVQTRRKHAVEKIMTSISETEITSEATPLRFGGQEIVNGVIMAEVLGPPRAKRKRIR